MKNIPQFSTALVRFELLAKREIALLDVREEADFALEHPLFAANLPLSRIEIELYTRIPRKDTLIVIYDNGEGFAKIAAERIISFGYSNVHLLEGGLQGWRSAGAELFQDVNAPSKAFGELVESKKHTPSFSATEVQALIDDKKDIVVLDARKFDEYHTMSIPSGISVPGAELVLRVKELAPRPETQIIVNCAGRTRSIIGTQSLINAAIPNPVAALRNGTIGWTLAGQSLEYGQTRRFGSVNPQSQKKAQAASIEVAIRAGVKRTNLNFVKGLLNDLNRTNYCFDVRTDEEYKTGHIPGFRFVPGGQLVQETDHYAPVRGARIILFDTEEVRANMTGSWLSQMGWEVYVLDDAQKSDLNEYGPEPVMLPEFPQPGNLVDPLTLAGWIARDKSAVVIDLSPSISYKKEHIPGAWFALRSQAEKALRALPAAQQYVLTSTDGIISRFAEAEFRVLTSKQIHVLEGGNNAWNAFNLPTEKGEQYSRFASPQADRYKRPYEGTDNAVEAMQAYLDWEYGLVEQLRRDGTHHFFVI